MKISAKNYQHRYGGFMQITDKVVQVNGSVYINRNREDFRSMPFSQIRFAEPDILWFEMYENQQRLVATAVEIMRMNIYKYNLPERKTIELQMINGQNVFIVFNAA